MKTSTKLISVLAMLLLSACALFSNSDAVLSQNDDVHYHAGFQVYKDGVLQDFSDMKYMHLEPCSIDDHEEENDPAHEQEEKAHLHSGIGDVVHVHRPGSVWEDLFVNINYPLDSDVVGYVNGEKVDDILHYPIHEYDSVVFLVGNSEYTDDVAAGAVTLEHIKEAEAMTETCGS